MKTYTKKDVDERFGRSDWQELEEVPDGVDLTFDGDLSLSSITKLPKGCNLSATGTIYLSFLSSLPKGICLMAGRHLVLGWMESIPEGVSLTAGDSLFLNRLIKLSSGVNLTAGGNIYLNRLKSMSGNCNLMAGLSLYLDQLTRLPEGASLMTGEDLRLPNLEDLSKDCKLEVGRDLWLDNLIRLPKNVKLMTRRNLILDRLKYLPEGADLTAGGRLSLGRLISQPKNYSLTAGSEVYTFSLSVADRIKVLEHTTMLTDGDYVEGEYIYADGILTPIKEKRKCGDYELYIGKIPGCNVVSDGRYYAHCDKFRDGIADILFKRAADRGAEQYKGMDLDTEMTVPELVTMYRVITGACRAGSERFVESFGPLKDRYTIREAIQITEGQYNSGMFASFFGM